MGCLWRLIIHYGTYYAIWHRGSEKKSGYQAYSGEWIGSEAQLEQLWKGSDVGGMETVAVKDGEYWVLNGAKNFITHMASGNLAW